MRARHINPGKFTFSLVVGSERIYRFIDDNMAAEMQDIAIVADPRVIAHNYRPFSVNATIQVDLSGQCASESIGPQHYSGIGGQWNFHYGTSLAEEGRAVMTLMSTGRGTVAHRADAAGWHRRLDQPQRYPVCRQRIRRG